MQHQQDIDQLQAMSQRKTAHGLQKKQKKEMQ
jgi:hypothetical protein